VKLVYVHISYSQAAGTVIWCGNRWYCVCVCVCVYITLER